MHWFYIWLQICHRKWIQRHWFPVWAKILAVWCSFSHMGSFYCASAVSTIFLLPVKNMTSYSNLVHSFSDKDAVIFDPRHRYRRLLWQWFTARAQFRPYFYFRLKSELKFEFNTLFIKARSFPARDAISAAFVTIMFELRSMCINSTSGPKFVTENGFRDPDFPCNANISPLNQRLRPIWVNSSNRK